MSRNRKELVGEVVRARFACPLCWVDLPWRVPDESTHSVRQLRIVGQRENGTRVECRGCGLRFTIDNDWPDALRIRGWNYYPLS